MIGVNSMFSTYLTITPIYGEPTPPSTDLSSHTYDIILCKAPRSKFLGLGGGAEGSYGITLYIRRIRS